MEHADSSQSSHLEVTYIPSHYLNGQNTSHGQAAVQGLLGRDTYVPSEWVWHLGSTSATEILSPEGVSFSDVSKNTSSKFPRHSDMGHQAYGARDNRGVFLQKTQQC